MKEQNPIHGCDASVMPSKQRNIWDQMQAQSKTSPIFHNVIVLCVML